MKSKIVEEFEKIKYAEDIYSFLPLLYLLFKIESVSITFREFSAMSGYPLRFLYFKDFPDLLDCNADFIVENLRKFTGVNISVLKNCENNKACLPAVSFERKLLLFEDSEKIYSFKNGSIKEDGFRDKETLYVISDIEKAERKNFYSKEKLIAYSQILRKEFFTDITTVCGREVFSGRMAFERFILDLKNKKIDSENLLGAVRLFKIQTALSDSISVYLLGLHHFVDRKFQNDLSEAIRSFQDFFMYVKECGRITGKNRVVSFMDRRRIANALRKAVSSYSKGMEKLYETELRIF